MDEATATAQADGSRPSDAAGRSGGRSGWATPAGLAITLIAALALALRVYRVVRPGLYSVTQYDDGPYFGSAVRLVHGVLPYRGFSFVQPPGITLLMAPPAALSFVNGTAWAMAAARILTAVAGAAGVVLAGLLVRHRGMLAVVATAGFLAVGPSSVAAAHTVMLEPWLVLFCLAGAVAVFDGDRLARSVRRLAWGGAAFGFAGAVKTWAILPVVVIAALSLPQSRRALVFAGGVAAGFLVPVLPFAAAAPAQFYRSVIAAQLGRNSSPVPLAVRLQDMLEIVQRHSAGHAVLAAGLAVFVLFVAGAYVIPALVSRRPPAALPAFAMTTSILVILAFLWPPYFSAHYTAFLEPFLAVALALPLAQLAASASGWSHWPAAGRWLPRAFAAVVVVVVAVGGAALLTGPKGGFTAGGIRRAIPPGACVLSDQVSYLLVTNRFVSPVPGCTQMVDSLGTDLALSDGESPASGAQKVPAVIAAWRDAFGHAQYVVLSPKNDLRVPWTPALRSYFDARFARLLTRSGFTVYGPRSMTRGWPERAGPVSGQPDIAGML